MNGPRTTLGDAFQEATRALGAMHLGQIRREPWPGKAFEGVARLPEALRREAAIQWAGRAANEHGSIQQFAAVLRATTEARLPLEFSGGLARLITDEVRHAELCGRLALALWPEGADRLSWPAPSMPWGAAPSEHEPRLLWIAEALLVACCLGETLSVPMLQAVAVVSTEPEPEAAAEQILRDEHLHARYGWEGLGWLWAQMEARPRAQLQDRLGARLRSFEQSCCGGARREDLLASARVVIEPGDPASPNLGTLTSLHYAAIFYDTLERTIFPQLEALGLDPRRAWAGPA